MKFVILSDTHGHHRHLDLPSGDVIIHGGDFSHFHNKEKALDFITWYKSLDYQYKVLIAGNHDAIAEKEPELFAKLLGDDILYLQETSCTINGIKIWGSPVQPDLIGWAFGRPRGEVMKSYWDLIPNDVDILLTHTPPYGILDKTSRGKSIGCEELMKKVILIEPQYHIFGHVHGSYGQEEIGNTTYINASHMNSKKGPINPPVVIEIESRKD